MEEALASVDVFVAEAHVEIYEMILDMPLCLRIYTKDFEEDGSILIWCGDWGLQMIYSILF